MGFRPVRCQECWVDSSMDWDRQHCDGKRYVWVLEVHACGFAELARQRVYTQESYTNKCIALPKTIDSAVACVQRETSNPLLRALTIQTLKTRPVSSTGQQPELRQLRKAQV